MKWRKVGEMEPMYKEDRKVDPIEANHVDGKIIVILVHFPRAIPDVPQYLPFVVRWEPFSMAKKMKSSFPEYGYWSFVYGTNSFKYFQGGDSYKIVAWMPLEEFEQSYQDLI